MTAEDQAPERDSAIAAYKNVLRGVLDARPSGTRQRLADAMSNNRSFITQIVNPAYATPIPGRHVETIFEICHFSARERELFLASYHLAHPGRLKLAGEDAHLRRIVLHVPDAGSAARNRRFDDMMAEVARRIAAFSADATADDDEEKPAGET